MISEVYQEIQTLWKVLILQGCNQASVEKVFELYDDIRSQILALNACQE